MKLFILVPSLFWVLSQAAWASKPIPKAPSHYIHDETGLIEKDFTRIYTLLKEEDQKQGNQILIALFNSLEQEDPVDYTNRLFTAWRPGEKDRNNGVILAAYLKERKIRIEVGYGNEPYLTDAISRRIIEEVIAPRFKNARYSEGVIEGIVSIQEVIHGNGYQRKAISTKFKPLLLIPLALLFALIGSIAYFERGSTTIRGGYHGLRHRSRIMTSGGFGDGGLGGGIGDGFSGGGGLSGGGGASGDW